MQYACEEPSSGANSSPFDEGIHNTNNNESRCGYGQTLLIVPTDAHYYKIIEMLKQFKIIILAPTCFGSRRNHHQGAVLCLAKTTNMVFLCLSV